MHDFIQHLSFAPCPPASGGEGDRAGAPAGRPTAVGTLEPLHAVLRSFNEAPAFRPSPRRKGEKAKVTKPKVSILP